MIADAMIMLFRRLPIAALVVFHGFIACDDDSARQECEAANGRWYEGDPFPEPFCSEATSDGGISCTDNAECEAWCQAPESSQEGDEVVGTCSGFTYMDCFQGVEDGRAEPEACH